MINTPGAAGAGPGARDRAQHAAGPRHADKLASQVARRIEAEIMRQGWPVGELIGSETALRERYGVSRAVLREAVRLVEHHRAAQMRRGPGGGLVVTAPDAAPATRALVIYLEYIGTTIDDLVHARRLLEPLALRTATGRITESGIAQLRRELAPRPAHEPGVHPHDRLHVLFARMSGNPTLHLLVDVLTRLTTRYAHTSRRISRDDTARTKAKALRAHGEIIDAAVAGYTGRAEILLDQHLTATAEVLERHRPDPDTPRSGIAADLAAMGPAAKRAEVVAARIHDEIAAAGWRIGEVHGSETHLLARYDASRSVLREAVRILENHAVARMRRGPGGGLVVTEPEPLASLGSIVLYLDHQGISGPDLRVVREAIELGCLDRVVARRHEPVVADQLRRIPAPAAGIEGADLLHLDLADLAGNPVLALFLRIVTELWARHIDARKPHALSGTHTPVVDDVHRRIVEAVIAGDVGVARYRMQRHLSVLSTWWH